MSNASILAIFLISIALHICTSDGVRLLILVDGMNSHVLMCSRLGLELARLGHDVRVLAPSSARVPDFARQYENVRADIVDDQFIDGGHFNYTTFAVDRENPFANSEEYSEMVLKSALAESTMERITLTYTALKKLGEEFDVEGEHLIQNVALMDEIRHGGYQFVLINPVTSFYAVPLSLGVPYGLLSLGLFLTSYRVPRLPSFSPVLSFDYTDTMTFTQRLVNLVSELAAQMVFSRDQRVVPTIIDSSADSTENNVSMSAIEAFRRSSMWLLFEDPATGYANPLMPNTIQVGELMTGRPGLPLPLHLDDFIAKSTAGAIVVSFGSYLDNIPDDIVSKFCDAFQRLPAAIHVIWKLKKTNPCSNGLHIKTLPWIPQNDLLADQRVRLFISHRGMNSLMETIYHAKPVIVFPLAVDQPKNTVAVVTKGLAIRLDIRDFTSDSLLMSIEKMLSDRDYEANARNLSSILRHRIDTPAERVSHAIEHVIKYGDSHLRTGAHELNLIEFFMIDLFAVIYSLAVVGVAICFVLCRRCYKCLAQHHSKKYDKDKAD